MPNDRAAAELLVVDPSLAGAAALLEGRRAGIDVFRLAAGGNALEQLAHYLDGHAPLQALHILSHGEAGTLFLAGERIDARSLDEQHPHLECIAAALDRHATLYLYGCSVAAGTRGAGFLAALEAALGASVIASALPVGSAALGGAWQFPLTGHAGVGLAFAPEVRASYAGLLASAALTTGADTPALSAGDDTVTASLANSLNNGDSIDGLGGNDTLIISAAQTVTFGATTLLNVENITITAGIVDITSNNATVAAGQTLTVDASASAATLKWNGTAETDGMFHLTGGTGNDTLSGGVGNDTLSGGLGADRLYVMEGNNTAYAGDGDDFVYALAGADLIYGEGGNDGLSGGGGNDTVWGGDGNDTLIGGAGDDLEYGDAGDDWIWGQTGDDTISGASGNDTLSGDAGNDILYGGDDSDLLRGLGDNDILYGEAGTDTLSGGAGSDTLSGGGGIDQFVGTASELNGDIVADLETGESIIVLGSDLSALDGTAASGTIDLGGGMSLSLTGISAASGSFTANYSGTGTTITFSATPANSAPVIGSDGGAATAALSAAENQSAVTTVTATDSDGDTPVFSITGGSDQARFTIDAGTGALSFVAPPDFEAPTDSDTNNTYVVEVTASDGNGGTDLQTITVTVTDANDPIAITSNGAGATASVSAAENQTVVTTVTATDHDGDTPVFSITGGSDQARFAIDASTGALSFVAPPNFEAPTDSDNNNTYVVDVTASDGNGSSDVQTLTVTVTNANEAIAITSNGAGATASVSASENQSAVTTVTATDADGDTPVFSITGGSDQARFAINASTGVLSFIAPPDFETPTDSDINNTYVVDVTASDGNGGTDVQTITVSVTNANEAISITSNGAGATASLSVTENQSALTTVTATDPDGATPVFSITGGIDQARFTIDAGTGALSFVVPPDFDAPIDSDTNNTYVVAVTASDGNGDTDVQTITVTVTDANEAIAITSNGGGATAAVRAAENQTAVTTVTAADADGDTPLFSIAGGSDQARFSIDPATGVLSFRDAPDFEAPTDGDANNTYLVNVAASDGKGGFAVQAITVTVSDIDDTLPPPPALDGDADLPSLSDLNDTVTAALPGTLNASDVIDGKLGFDTLILAAAQTVVLGPATLRNVEQIIVSAGMQDITTDDATVAPGVTFLLDGSASADAIAWNGSAETDGSFRLLTGSGNDSVQGGQGNDVIVTGLGQDTVAGGGGNDAIDGGGGRDVVQLSGSRTDYALRVSGGQVVFTQLGSGTDGVDTVANVEAIQFAASGPDTGPAGSIARLFDTLFNRAPALAEADFWLERTEAGLSLRDISAAMLSLPEGQLLFSGVGNSAFVESVYQQALGRSADATERSYWGGALDSGGISRADAALLIADSDEKLALTAALETDFNTTEIATFVRMYEVLFDRRPDQAGINYWIGSNEAGHSMHRLALSILGTDEMSSTHGALSDQQFIDLMYQDGLERTASGAETGYWLDLLANGSADRAEVLIVFVNSTEMLELIGPINTSNILI